MVAFFYRRRVPVFKRSAHRDEDDIYSHPTALPLRVSTMPRSAALIEYDQLDYGTAWPMQRRVAHERARDAWPDTLFLLEHDPVYTVGRSGQVAQQDHFVVPPPFDRIPCHRVERGGSVTYHGPGQIVGYPILRLRDFCAGPKAYMRMLEEVITRVLGEWGITAHHVDKFPGVWVGRNPSEKIAAMGVRISEGVTMHGFALNVTMDLAPFHAIVPCGIPGCRATSMAAVLGQPVPVAEVRRSLAARFSDVFGLEWMQDFDRDPLQLPPPGGRSSGKVERGDAHHQEDPVTASA